MRTPTEKTIHGRRVSQHTFLIEITQALERLGSAKVSDLVLEFGPEWNNPVSKRLLTSTLINMEKRGTLRLLERGLYAVNTSYLSVHGVSQFDRTEQDILEVIRDRGGFCRWRDLTEAFGVRVRGPDADIHRQDSMHSRLREVISKSTRIRQDHLKRGVYNIPWEETQKLPLMGRWAAMMIEVGCDVIRSGIEVEDFETYWREERDMFFINVGRTFKAARELRRWEIARIVRQPAVKKAIEAMLDSNVPEARKVPTMARDAITNAVNSLRAAGASYAEIDELRHSEAAKLDDAMLFYAYERFEDGELGAHWGATVGFYTAVAEVFELCPAALSRGLLAHYPAKERLSWGGVWRI